MGLIFRLEQKYHRFAIPNITVYWIVGQALFFFLIRVNPEMSGQIALVPREVMNGEFWRLLTFMFVPKWEEIIWALFGWYVLYLIGSALENSWGAFRYNLYLLIAYLATLTVAGGMYFIDPLAVFGNFYIQGSVFLAFAFLYPDFEFLLFFIVPMKVKYLAYVTWALYFISFAMGDWAIRGMIAAATLNFFVFFGEQVFRRMAHGKRAMEFGALRSAETDKPFHRCAVCGITDKSNPDAEFRYCSKCAGNPGYCMEHIENHEHLSAE